MTSHDNIPTFTQLETYISAMIQRLPVGPFQQNQPLPVEPFQPNPNKKFISTPMEKTRYHHDVPNQRPNAAKQLPGQQIPAKNPMHRKMEVGPTFHLSSKELRLS